LLKKITIDPRHQGPFGSANGGYVAGILGDALRGAPSSVRIHQPVPVGTPVYLYRRGETAFIRHNDQTVATAELMQSSVPTTRFVSVDDVLGASDPDIDLGMFAGCFVCGQPTPEGLGVRAKALPDGRFAAIWRPLESRHVTGWKVPAVYLRSALDCPGGFAALTANQTLALTGTLTSSIEFLPDADSTLIVVGEATNAEGRKLGAVSSIYTDSEELVATASAVWIAIPGIAMSADAMAVA
jgi:acyl-coenzyme A thioesterase PaaI-like protein